MTKPFPDISSVGRFTHLVEKLYGYDIFISYTRQDDPNSVYVLALQAMLTQGSDKDKRDPMRCFLDLRDLPHDDELRRAIEAKIRVSRYVLLVAGPHSENHPWMCFEAEMARKHKRRMIVVDRGIVWERSGGNLKQTVGDILAIPADTHSNQPTVEVGQIADTVGNFRLARVRSLIWGGVVAALCTFLAAAVLWGVVAKHQRGLAELARDKAEKEQRSSEQLVQEMQTNIRAALLTLGRLDLMYDIHNAIEMYLTQSTSPSEAKVSLRAVQEFEEGETFLDLQDNTSSKLHFEKALSYAREAKWFATGGWKARRYGWILYRLTEPGTNNDSRSEPDHPLSDEFYKVAERIVTVDPTDVDAQRLWTAARERKAAKLPPEERITALQNICNDLEERLKATSSDQRMERSSLVLTLATTRDRLIRALGDQGKIGDAVTLADTDATDLENLNMNSAAWQLELARAFSLAGDLHLRNGSSNSAATRYKRSVSHLDDLIATEPRNLRALGLLSHCLEELIGIEKNGGSPADQLESLKNRLRDVQSMTARTFPATDAAITK